MKIYSNGKDRTLTGKFPSSFKLSNNGVDVPFIRTGIDSLRLSGDVPFGELDVIEVIKKPKTEKKEKKVIDAMYLSVINRKDVEKIENTEKELKKLADGIKSSATEIENLGKDIYSYEAKNKDEIDQTNKNIQELAKVFGKEIQADRESLRATSSGLKQVISETAEVLDAKIQAHEVAKNPHKITKGMIGLDAVDNTSDLDKPVSKATQKALDEKADKSDIEELDKKITESSKKQESFQKSFDNMNLYGGVGGNELPSGIFYWGE